MAQQKTPPAELLAESIGFPPVAPGFDAKFIADLGAKAAEAQVVDLAITALQDTGLPPSIPVVWDPRTGQLISVKGHAEAYRLKPREKSGSAKALTLATFISLTNRHKTEHSVVFADTTWTKPSFTAVIDYHPNISGGSADNGKHRVRYDFPLSEEWQAWVKQDGEVMDQMDFAIFLEDRAIELSSPTDAEKIALERDFSTTVATPSELVQLSRGLKVRVSSTVEAEHTLASGAGEIKWSEQHQGADGTPLKVPGVFLLAVAPFFAGEKMRIPVRLRYRPSGGKVKWFYQIYRPDLHVTERVQSDLNTVATETALPTFEGNPEMAA